MSASALTPEQDRELAVLRRRAYGPNADIDADPAAQRRLLELEESGRVPAPPPPPVNLAAAPAVAPTPEVPVEQGPLPASEGEAPPPRTAATRRLLSRVPPLGWIVAAATVVLVATAVWSVAQVTARNSDLTLAEIDAEDPPPALVADNYFTTLYGADSEGLRAHEAYRTITPWSWSGTDGTRCLLLTVEGFDRAVDGECTPPGLDPVGNITVWPGLPSDLIGDLPQGSVIRFELHGERVHVWVRAANARS